MQQAFIDGHVHIYPAVPLASVFSAAYVNLRRAAGAAATPPGLGVLLLADPSGVDGFGRLAALGPAGSRPAEVAGWAVETRREDALHFRHENSQARLAVLRGQQVVTREGLEVLATGAHGRLRDGDTLAATLAAVRSRGGWSTIAWGAGKWLGRRGRLVTQAIEAEAGSGDVALGDNGGRPWCWAAVPQFRTAAGRGMRVLPGSDPLPVRGDERRVGSYGFTMALDADRALVPALAEALASASNEINAAGRRVGVWRFAVNQLRLKGSRS